MFYVQTSLVLDFSHKTYYQKHITPAQRFTLSNEGKIKVANQLFSIIPIGIFKFFFNRKN